jgi:hypothetical protein
VPTSEVYALSCELVILDHDCERPIAFRNPACEKFKMDGGACGSISCDVWGIPGD